MQYFYLISYLGIKNRRKTIPGELLVTIDKELKTFENINELRKYVLEKCKFKNIIFQNIVLLNVIVSDESLANAEK